MELPELIGEISTLESQFEVFRYMKRLVGIFDARGFIVMKVPSAPGPELGNSSVITNWPPELVAKYDSRALLSKSPALMQVLKSVVPFAYDVEKLYASLTDERSVAAREVFLQFGFGRGGIFPTSNIGGERGVIILSGDRAPFTLNEMMQLHLIATHVYDRLFQIKMKDPRAYEDLTEREIDCLTWTAEGKTSTEIAEILTLSEHTINHYLNRAAKKLGTVNRTQAVAKALRSGVIR